MNPIVSHPYTGLADVQAMVDLLNAVQPTGRISDYPSPSDLREMLGTADIQATTRLWENLDGRLVGFALVDPWNNLLFEVQSWAFDGNIESQIVAWGVACIQRAMEEHGEPLTLDASCRDDDTERIRVLEQHGFVIQSLCSMRMTRSLNGLPSKPQMPPGFILRPMAGEHEAQALVALHRAAFGTQTMTVAYRRSMMCEPDYDPALDLVIVAPDDTLVATCTCSVSEEENVRTGRSEGYVDIVATHPRFRRQGLARALVSTGLHLLRQRGVQTAVLGTNSQNIAMQQVAEALGFRTVATKVWFEKQVSE